MQTRAANIGCLKTAAFVMVLTIGTAAFAEDWPQWRGPNSTGLSKSKKPLPVEFSPTDHVRWSVELGEGVCSPTIVAGRVFSTAILGDEDEERRFAIFCFDAADGHTIWERKMPVGKKPLAAIHEATSYASATPTADAERVYVYFTRLGLMALDTRSGETVWRLPVPEPYYIFDWGPGMSPVLHGDNLYFCQDDDLSPALYAIEKKTGKVLWKDDRSDIAVCYSHPVICETPAGPEVVVAGTGKLMGYNIADGKRKWAAELFCRNIKTTPISLDGIIYVSVESYGMSYQWRATADADGDGKITRDEIRASRKDKGVDIPDAFWKKFERGDTNKDDILEGEEIDLAFLDPSNQGGLLAREVQARGKGESDWKRFDDELQKESSVQAIRGGGKGDVTKTHVLWKKVTKAPDHLVSPLVLDGRILFIKGEGIASCLDAATGEPIWSQKRIGNLGTCLGSPVAGDGKVYAASLSGHVAVLESGPALKILANNDMGESIVGTPGIADGRLYIRTRTKLYCVE
jgi:outer membrane protein assembly factor BamB